MKKSKKKVYVGLSADILHKGHINILKTANNYGDVYVGLLTDQAISSYKNIPYLDFEKRKIVIENIKYVKKVIEGRPNAVDAMLSKEIHLVINTAEGSISIKDSFSLRQTALLNKIPYYTTLQGAHAASLAIEAIKKNILNVKSIQSYFE